MSVSPGEIEDWPDNPTEGVKPMPKDWDNPRPRFVTKAEEQEYDRTHPQRRAADIKASNPKDSIGIAKAYASTLPRPVLWNVALAMLEGALKYGRHNYRAVGVRASVYYDAFSRHVDRWWEGEDIDPDSALHHLDKAIACLVVMRDAMLQGKCEDDRPPPSPVGWMDDLNEKAMALLSRYPEEQRKEPYTINRRS